MMRLIHTNGCHRIVKGPRVNTRSFRPVRLPDEEMVSRAVGTGGFCLHDGLEWFTRAGFLFWKPLQTAMINPVRFLGREDSQGTVEVGKRADLVVLEADPLVDIRNVTRISSVILRGTLMMKPSIDSIVAKHLRPGALTESSIASSKSAHCRPNWVPTQYRSQG